MCRLASVEIDFWGRMWCERGCKLICLDRAGWSCYTARVMTQKETSTVDLSALDTAAMRSRLSELGSYL